jgi:hypothetical protein
MENPILHSNMWVRLFWNSDIVKWIWWGVIRKINMDLIGSKLSWHKGLRTRWLCRQMKYVTNFEVRGTVEEINATHRTKETELLWTDEDFCLRMTWYCMPRARRERGDDQREARKKILRPVQALIFPNPWRQGVGIIYYYLNFSAKNITYCFFFSLLVMW